MAYYPCTCKFYFNKISKSLLSFSKRKEGIKKREIQSRNKKDQRAFFLRSGILYREAAGTAHVVKFRREEEFQAAQTTGERGGE